MNNLGLGLTILISSVLTLIALILLIREFRKHKDISNDYKEETVKKLTKLETNQKWTIDTMKLNFDNVAEDLQLIERKVEKKVDSLEERIRQDAQQKLYTYNELHSRKGWK